MIFNFGLCNFWDTPYELESVTANTPLMLTKKSNGMTKKNIVS
jgi:hypothetical protein